MICPNIKQSWRSMHLITVYLYAHELSLSTVKSSYLVRLSFLGQEKKNVKTHLFSEKKKLSLTNFSTGLLCECEQHGAPG